MNSTLGARKESLVVLPALSARVIEQGDQCYWDSSNNRVEPFSQQADNVGEEDNQAEAATLFLGVCHKPSNDGDEEVTVDIGMERTVYDLTVPSATYRFGTWLGASENSGGDGILDQQLEAVSSEDLALYMVLDDDSSARTTVVATPVRSYVPAQARRRKEVNVETLADDKVLTHDDKEIQALDPDGATRNVDLPAEEESAGLGFTILNKGAGTEVITVRDDAANTIGTIDGGAAGAAEALRVECDGSAWVGYGVTRTT